MSRIRIALGNIEIEYEGEQNFIEGQLTELITDMVALASRLPSQSAASDFDIVTSTPTAQVYSTNTIAQMISAKTGSDLALAAIARICLVDMQSQASRSDILDEMREATTYFKDTYASNLSSYLDTLVKSKRVNLVARGSYALAAAERGRLEQALAKGV